MAKLVAYVVCLSLFAVATVACSSDPTDSPSNAATSTTCFSPRDESVAYEWNEALLDAIRRDFPAPTVHARNLFHTSAVMWDAWAAYEPKATGYFVERKQPVDDARDNNAARSTAASIAAHHVLVHRYRDAVGGETSVEQFDGLLAELCGTVPAVDEVEPDSPEALGYEIANAVLDFGRTDGSLEQSAYLDFSYEPVNPPLVVAGAWEPMLDPDRWQPLALDVQATQNDIELPASTQTYVGPHWGRVTGFALTPSADGLPFDPGAPPFYGSTEYAEAALEVVRRSSLLASDAQLDISPATRGNNSLGTDDGTGHDINPATGEPYLPQLGTEADFTRVLAEFWADGPDSETPPGHWNTLANDLDIADSDRKIGGVGPIVDRLEWDTKLYFALNGATHDAAIGAWGSKAFYDYSRPISMIRHLADLGELPLEPGLSEIITAESAAAGERHEHLSDHVGATAIFSWLGSQDDQPYADQTVGWILGTRWLPYQRETFVTPAFASYVSGHSVFSRSAAEILTSFTGSEYFPGGMGSWTVRAGSLDFEQGPSADVELQWATYYDAADQAGQSRLWGGIHVPVDDYQGRIMGAAIGKDAWTAAQRYFD